jgi:hypothetical protein
MSTALRRWYGAHPSQLPLMLAAGALAGYAVLHLAGDPAWPRMLLWFAAAVIGHDLVLFPLYTAADGLLVRTLRRWRAVNYVRVPALASLLTLVLFLPGIIRQGADTYLAATGLTQQPFLGRWLVLVAAFFVTSAVVFGVRRFLDVRRRGDTRRSSDERPSRKVQRPAEVRRPEGMRGRARP